MSIRRIDWGGRRELPADAEAEFAEALDGQLPGLDYWLQQDADGTPWLAVSCNLAFRNRIRGTLRLDYDGRGMRGCWSPGGLNWDDGVRASGAPFDTGPPDGLSTGELPIAVAADVAAGWFADHLAQWDTIVAELREAIASCWPGQAAADVLDRAAEACMGYRPGLGNRFRPVPPPRSAARLLEGALSLVARVIRWRWAAADEDLPGQLAWRLRAEFRDGRGPGLNRADCVAAGRAAVAVFARHGLYPGQPPVYWEPPWPPWQPRARGDVRVVRVPLRPD